MDEGQMIALQKLLRFENHKKTLKGLLILSVY